MDDFCPRIAKEAEDKVYDILNDMTLEEYPVEDPKQPKNPGSNSNDISEVNLNG